MMWTGILAGAAACYVLKLAGLSVPQRVLEDRRVQKIAVLLPVALLAALTVTQTFSQGHRLSLDARAVGLAVAVAAVLRRAPFLVVVCAAAASAALFRLLT
ncbi:MAG TPA: AzlD domain-containing protein [Trebonia sp.]|jgi:branched-subunit amino acid transport protein